MKAGGHEILVAMPRPMVTDRSHMCPSSVAIRHLYGRGQMPPPTRSLPEQSASREHVRDRSRPCHAHASQARGVLRRSCFHRDDGSDRRMTIIQQEPQSSGPRRCLEFRLRKQSLRRHTLKPGVSIGSQVFSKEIQQHLNLGSQARRTGEEGAEGDRLWAPERQYRHQSVARVGALGHI